MAFARRARRIAVAAGSLAALLAVAACGGSSESGSEAGGEATADAAYDQKGPITYAAGKDFSGNVPKLIAQWNADHPDEKVTFRELPENADQQRQQMLQNAQIKSDSMTVLSMDVVWTAEFAANQIVDEMPADKFPMDEFLPATVKTVTYFNKVYGYPMASDGGLLYYRKDLLDKYNLQPPTTWDELRAACDTIQEGEDNDKLDCYAGQFNKYEGLTVNFSEAVNSAGGVIIGEDGKPNVSTPEAATGLNRLVNWFKDGTIPKGAITWKEEESRVAFQSGNLIFLRNWPYVYANAQKDDGSSKVNGKFAVSPLTGETGPGVSSLGGHNMAISKYAKNKGTAVEFVKWWNSEEIQKSNVLATSNAPTRSNLYTDPDITAKLPFMPILLKSIETAQPRPVAVRYGDVTLAIQDSAYSALQGQTPTEQALSELQTKLESLIQ